MHATLSYNFGKILHNAAQRLEPRLLNYERLTLVPAVAKHRAAPELDVRTNFSRNTVSTILNLYLHSIIGRRISNDSSFEGHLANGTAELWPAFTQRLGGLWITRCLMYKSFFSTRSTNASNLQKARSTERTPSFGKNRRGAGPNWLSTR